MDENVLHIQMPSWCSGLCASLHKLQQGRQLCDMTIFTSEGRELSAHSAVLASASPLLLYSLMSQPDAAKLRFRNITCSVWHLMLDFMYTGQMLLPTADIPAMLKAANFLQIQPLINALETLSQEPIECEVRGSDLMEIESNQPACQDDEEVSSATSELGTKDKASMTRIKTEDTELSFSEIVGPSVKVPAVSKACTVTKLSLPDKQNTQKMKLDEAISTPDKKDGATRLCLSKKNEEKTSPDSHKGTIDKEPIVRLKRLDVGMDQINVKNLSKKQQEKMLSPKEKSKDSNEKRESVQTSENILGENNQDELLIPGGVRSRYKRRKSDSTSIPEKKCKSEETVPKKSIEMHWLPGEDALLKLAEVASRKAEEEKEEYLIRKLPSPQKAAKIQNQGTKGEIVVTVKPENERKSVLITVDHPNSTQPPKSNLEDDISSPNIPKDNKNVSVKTPENLNNIVQSSTSSQDIVAIPRLSAEKSQSSRQVQDSYRNPSRTVKLPKKLYMFICTACHMELPSSAELQKHKCVPSQQSKRPDGLMSAIHKDELPMKENEVKQERIDQDYDRSHEKLDVDTPTGKDYLLSDVNAESQKTKEGQTRSDIKDFNQQVEQAILNSQSHASENNKSQEFVCLVCDQKYATKDQLDTHVKCYHLSLKAAAPDQLSVCTMCKCVINTHNHGLAHHMWDIHGHKTTQKLKYYACSKVMTETGFLCDFRTCDAGNYRQHTKNMHMTIVGAGYPAFCKDCDQIFDNSAEFTTHSTLHNWPTDKPYRCHICGSLFTRLTSLEAHIPLHTGKYPYICKICHDLFAGVCSLNRHLTMRHQIPKHNHQSNTIYHMYEENLLTKENYRKRYYDEDEGIFSRPLPSGVEKNSCQSNVVESLGAGLHQVQTSSSEVVIGYNLMNEASMESQRGGATKRDGHVKDKSSEEVFRGERDMLASVIEKLRNATGIRASEETPGKDLSENISVDHSLVVESESNMIVPSSSGNIVIETVKTEPNENTQDATGVKVENIMDMPEDDVYVQVVDGLDSVTEVEEMGTVEVETMSVGRENIDMYVDDGDVMIIDNSNMSSYERGKGDNLDEDTTEDSNEADTRKVSVKMKQHACPYCHKRYYSTASLEEHLPIHTGYKPYSCTICAQEFLTIYAINKHLREEHNLNKSELKSARKFTQYKANMVPPSPTPTDLSERCQKLLSLIKEKEEVHKSTEYYTMDEFQMHRMLANARLSPETKPKRRRKKQSQN